ncbi:MAG TPA: PIN domain-containing protein [Terriglobales bacterium]|nr:PIN domain-containing protein [Terriglobales bacterium]
MKIALDSNVLLYAEGLGDERRVQTAFSLIEVLPESTSISVQALGEVYNVMVRKGGFSRDEAHHAASRWQARFSTTDVDHAVMTQALVLAARYQLSIWDAVQLAAAAAAGCEMLLTEDLQDGFHWGGVEVVNPFLTRRREWLETRLREDG